LATVKMYLGLAKIKNPTSNKLNFIDKSYDYVNEAMEEIRKLSHSLVAPSLGSIGLQESLEDLIQDLSIEKNIKFTLLYDLTKSNIIDTKKELMLYRIVQEQLNNIRKYATAKNVTIQLSVKGEYQHLIIIDDGVGFDTSTNYRGIGLKNIKSRIDFYKGNMEIISSPGKGCTLKITIPFKNTI